MIPELDYVRVFAGDWVSQNLQAISSPARLEFQVDCWAAQMTADARRQGIAGGDLARCLGDLDDYLTAQYYLLPEMPPWSGADRARDS